MEAEVQIGSEKEEGVVQGTSTPAPDLDLNPNIHCNLGLNLDSAFSQGICLGDNVQIVKLSRRTPRAEKSIETNSFELTLQVFPISCWNAEVESN